MGSQTSLYGATLPALALHAACCARGCRHGGCCTTGSELLVEIGGWGGPAGKKGVLGVAKGDRRCIGSGRVLGETTHGALVRIVGRERNQLRRSASEWRIAFAVRRWSALRLHDLSYAVSCLPCTVPRGRVRHQHRAFMPSTPRSKQKRYRTLAPLADRSDRERSHVYHETTRW
jgi:hypothetical protein